MPLQEGCNNDVDILLPGGTTPSQSEIEGQTIADQIEIDAELEDFEIRRIPSNTGLFGPKGSLYGAVLEDSLNSVYVLGKHFPDGTVEITGVVLEDISDNLILMEEITAAGNVRITIPTGDSAEYEILPEGGLRITMTLRGSSPPSTLVYEIDATENVTIDHAASQINLIGDAGYNDGSIEVTRAAKAIRLQRALKPTQMVALQRFDCPSINSIITTADVTCALWTVVTSQAPTRAIDAACLSANGFLGGFRGSDFLPGGQPGPETAPVTVAALKLGVNAVCSLVKAGWSVGKLLKKASLPDLLCMGVTIVEEGTRVITGGETINDAICEAIGGTPTHPEQDPFFAEGCDNTCPFAFDDQCDDGGPNSDLAVCAIGTDCSDCGSRDPNAEEEEPDCFDDGICNMDCPITPRDPDCMDIDFCENFSICCNGDGICDLARCPQQSDSDCTNFDFCDRTSACCRDDDRCDSTGFDCPELDEDCNDCDAGNVCVTLCEPIDPDCAVVDDCPQDDFCEDCVGDDPDCDRCGSGDGCVTGCETDDPDCEMVTIPCGPTEFCCDTDLFCGGLFCFGETDDDCNLCGIADGFCMEVCSFDDDHYPDPDCDEDLCAESGRCCDGDGRCDEKFDSSCFNDSDCDRCPGLDATLDGLCIQDCQVPDGDCVNERQCEDFGQCCPNDGVCDLDFFLCNGGLDFDCPRTNAGICAEFGICCPGDGCFPRNCPDGDPGCVAATETAAEQCADFDVCCPNDGRCECTDDPDCDGCQLPGTGMDGVCVLDCVGGDADCINDSICITNPGCCFESDGSFESDSCYNLEACLGGIPPRCPTNNTEACAMGLPCCPGDPCIPRACPDGCP